MLTQTTPPTLSLDAPPNLIPVVRSLPADLETPVSVYLKLAGTGPSFLLESVTGGSQLARYSFIGVMPRRAYVVRRGQITVLENGERRQLSGSGTPLDLLRRELARYRPQSIAGLPPLIGGLVGYLGYGMAHHFEPAIPPETTPEGGLPDAIFLLADTLVAFDHAFGKVYLIANADTDENPAAVEEAGRRLDELERQLRLPLPAIESARPEHSPAEFTANMSRQAFHSMVEAAREHIAAGDIFQVVLSQRLSRQTEAPPFAIYRALRRLNPSPYMFYLNFATLAGDEPLQLIGASPEVHVKLSGDHATLRPIAGTRRRGASPPEDDALQSALLADPKERAEHVMLIDLARNDLGRVCAYGSMRVPQLMVVERYSHVMHLVSQVEGRLRPGYDAFDLLQATFPAGTVSGAPKIRAMQIIAELEKDARRAYAGAVGYVGFDGAMDTCITIRTLVMQGNRISVQAGAGIVADSEPEKEYQETLSKARALAVAVDMAEGHTL